jgi:hypothetical protein
LVRRTIGNAPVDGSTLERPSGGTMKHEPPDDDLENDPRVSTVPLTTDDGDEVVISQQNVGPGNQVGSGEFETNAPAAYHRTPAEAAREQDELDRDLEREQEQT